MRQTLSTFAIAAAALLAPATPWAAPTLYDFTFTETRAYSSATGSFSGQFEVDNGFIVGISGSGAVLGTISSLLGPGEFFGNDNVFTEQSPWVNFKGVSFVSTQRPTVNLYYSGNVRGWGTATGNGGFSGSEGTLTVTQVTAGTVPEPTGLALVALALGALAATRRRA